MTPAQKKHDKIEHLKRRIAAIDKEMKSAQRARHQMTLQALWEDRYRLRDALHALQNTSSSNPRGFFSAKEVKAMARFIPAKIRKVGNRIIVKVSPKHLKKILKTNPEEKKGGYSVHWKTHRTWWPLGNGYHKTKAAAEADARNRRKAGMPGTRYKVVKVPY